MVDRVLNATQYAEYLGICLQTFSSMRRTNPQDFAPSFFIGKRERWFESTIVAYHKAKENTPQEGVDNNAQTKGGFAD